MMLLIFFAEDHGEDAMEKADDLLDKVAAVVFAAPVTAVC